MNTGKWICVGLAIAGISACTQTVKFRVEPGAEDITPHMMLEDSPLADGAGLQDLSHIDMLELTPDMVVFLEEHVDESLSSPAKLRSLLDAVMGQDHFELIYDDSTRTASETFREQHGNCLSFTNMFVAMARHVGLDASYQEVEIAPEWSSAGQSFLLSQHVNVFVDFKGHYTPRIVDFNFSYEPDIKMEFDLVYDHVVISDKRARAHYFNNMGVEHMLYGGDTSMAFANYRESLREDPAFSPAWINLGILYRRDGYVEYAKSAYLQALANDPSNLVAMSNLASLYEQQGQAQQAEYYRQQVSNHRMKNPYYRYSLAQAAVIEGNYEEARDHLKYAIARRENESRFYLLMSISYAISGDQKEARKWMAQAEELAEKESDKQHYRHKIEKLMSLGEPYPD